MRPLRWSRGRLAAITCLIVTIPFLVLSPELSFSQANTATFHGTVTDPTGAVVPGATVTLTEQNTGAVRQQVTDADGEFVFTFLPAGTYRLRIETSGFKAYVMTDIRLAAGQQVRQRFALELGEVTESVTVSG